MVIISNLTASIIDIRTSLDMMQSLQMIWLPKQEPSESYIMIQVCIEETENS